jgi:deazaflavin-dependent oxidoreductase (nitroreductase family)
MPLPDWMRQVNGRVTNHLTRLLTMRAPALADRLALERAGIVIHRGRHSGKTYRTPVNVFAQSDGYAIGLPFGRDVDWVKNVMAAQTCELESHGERVRLCSPRLVHDEQQRLVGGRGRRVLALLHISDFLLLSFVPHHST